MPARANSLESAFIAGALAAAALLGLNTTASSAAECRENPSLRTAEPGHWYFHSDRTRHRRCWFFVPAAVTAGTSVSASPAATASPPPAATVSAPSAATVGYDPRQSWLPSFLPGFLQPPPPPPQQTEMLQTEPNTIPDRSAEATQTVSPKPARPNKIVRRERPQIAPPPTTTGAADPRDQPEQSASDKKQDLPLNEADRESLFQDFIKWQMDRNLFGRP
jgi:hypothetical protein